MIGRVADPGRPGERLVVERVVRATPAAAAEAIRAALLTGCCPSGRKKQSGTADSDDETAPLNGQQCAYDGPGPSRRLGAP